MTNNSSLTPDPDPFDPIGQVMDAIDEAESELQDEGLLDDEKPRDADAVRSFITDALESAPFANWNGVPEVLFDIADDSEAAWRPSHRNGTVHLHPRLTDRWLLLNLTAAWLTPNHTHGPRFCRVLITLVRSALGDEAAYILNRTFDDYGVEVLPDDRRTA